MLQRRIRGVGVVMVSMWAGLAATAAAADPPREFYGELTLVSRVVACATDEAPPKPFDAAVVDAHCKEMKDRYARFRQRYVAPATAFFQQVRPEGLPTAVVYPFGGGDLVSALIAYPDAREITTISLEHAGDPTKLPQLEPARLAASLKLFRDASGGLLANNDSATENMMKVERGSVPGQLSFSVMGMAVLGYEPLWLRFFRLDDKGVLVYLSAADVAAAAHTDAKKKKGIGVDTDFSEAFTNMEIGFRRRGDRGAPLIVHRHLAANLANKEWSGSPLQKHLVAKGKVVVITKAASYLLWLSSFSKVRDYLLDHMVFMVSDSTGIPPRYARKRRFSQTTYGRFNGSFLKAADDHNEDFRKLWAEQKYRRLDFRFGYPDNEEKVHLMITRPEVAAAATATAPGPAK